MSERANTQQWLKAWLGEANITGTALARAIGVAPSTINKQVNGTAASEMKGKTLRMIADYFGTEPMAFPGQKRPAGLREPDATPYAGDDIEDDIARTVAQAWKTRNSITPWVLTTRALEAAGFMPGDILLVDLNERPRPRDAVCAQVYDWTSGKHETVMRIYAPPYLVAASGDDAMLKPYVVDDDSVVIKGVITASFRRRRAA